MAKNIILFILISLCVFSCNDDFQLNDEWQDITIVYGLLNSSDDVQYIKINKAFLDDGDVYHMASASNSIQYTDVLDVRLLEFEIADPTLTPYYHGNWNRTARPDIIMERTNDVPKDTGIFSNEDNYLYQTTEKISDGYKYILTITNRETHKNVWSETYMIYKLRVTSPINHENFKIPMANELAAYYTHWESAVYGKIYQTAIQFHYLDIINSDTSYRTIQIEYDEQTAKEVRTPFDAKGFELRQKVGGVDFYQKIARKINAIPDIMRIPLTIDFIYYVGGQSLSTYLSVSKSSANYGQMETSYTNIKNGKGIFDCRFRYILMDKELTMASIDSLHRGRFTHELNFVNYTLDSKWLP